MPLSADTYYQAQDEFGGIGYSLDQIRGQSVEKREIADATLAGALELKLKPSSRARRRGLLPELTRRQARPPGLLRPRTGRRPARLSAPAVPVHVGVGRFAKGGDPVPMGKLQPGEWANLRIPTDSAPDKWWVTVDGPVRVCPPGSTG